MLLILFSENNQGIERTTSLISDPYWNPEVT